MHPEFGTLATMDELIAACHARGIRVWLDYVPNHTSDRRPRFIESCSSRDKPKRDWYCRRDPAPDGGPPDNWLGAFGGDGWTWDERTGQYWLHWFLVEQPDLNRRNPEVLAAMRDVVRFWLRRGSDGFRGDVMSMVLKDPQPRDNPPNPDWDPAGGLPDRAQRRRLYNRNWPDVYDAVRGIRAVTDEFPDRMLIGEVFGSPENIAAYYGGGALDGLHLAFNFGMIGGRGAQQTAWNADHFRHIVNDAEAALPPSAWPNYVLGNHDQPRLATRYGRERNAAAALLLLTLRGTPLLYDGDEIGKADVPIPEDRARDPARFHAHGRDPERTPMQWQHAPFAGFSTAQPWLPTGDLAIKVAAPARDARSLLSLYRRLNWPQKRTPALNSGRCRALDGAPPGVFAFVREAAGARVAVAINFESEERQLAFPAGVSAGRVLCSSACGREGGADP